jgi:hypothetical protein
VVEPLQFEQRRRQRHHDDEQPLVFLEPSDHPIRIDPGERPDEMGHPENAAEQRRVDEGVDLVQELTLTEQHAGT